MRRFLLLILPLMLIGCSKDEIEEPPKEYVIETTYLISLREVCHEGLADKYVVDKDDYDFISNSYSLDDCTQINVKGIDGEFHAGIFSGAGTIKAKIWKD